MEKFMKFIRNHKVLMVTLSLIFLFALIIGIPSLAKLKHRNSIYGMTEWDGTVATSYSKGSGKENDPYIISNASEFAFFVEKLKTQSYENEYFELGNDIVINSGVFDYSKEEGIKLKKDETVYFLNEENNEYYTTLEKSGTSIGKINSLTSINNFKGYLDGKSYSIYGLYISDLENENLAIFKTLEGTVKNLYFSNSVVNGIGNVAGLAVNSISSNIENVSYNGFVINKSDVREIKNELNNVSVLSNKGETKTSIGLPNVTIPEGVSAIKLKGDWIGEEGTIGSMKVQFGESIFDISLDSNHFEVELGIESLRELFFLTTSTIDGNSIEFTNLQYVIEYYDQITSGIVGTTTSTTMTNVINKATIYGNYIASGIVGTVKDSLKIERTYNVGFVNFKNIGSGIIGEINNNQNKIEIINSYNKGEIKSLNDLNKSAGIIGVANNNTGLIDLSGVINLSDNYAINVLNNSTINVKKSYSLNGLSVSEGTISNPFEQTTESELYLKDTLTGIGYNEFKDLEDVSVNENNAWVYEDNSMPILYIDDLNNPVANIKINKLIWNNLSSELDVLEVSSNIVFSIENVSVANPALEMYYYFTDSKVPMSKADLEGLQEWKEYTEPVKIETSGYYVIYAKAVDALGKTTYINTDILMLNVSGYQASITVDDYVWDEFKTELSNIYINKSINATIFAHNDLLDISSMEYFISNEILTKEQVEKNENWINYESPILINETGNYVIYAKITDAEQKIKYVNSDLLIYNGYKETLTIGNKGSNYETNYVTTSSSINLAFTSDFNLEFKEGYTHNIVSSILLPKGTKLTLKDKLTNKVYGLEITSDEDLYGYNNSCNSKINCIKYATYNFELFSEIGKLSEAFYDESVNFGKILKNENYVLIIDFGETALTENYYDVSFYLTIKNSEEKNLYTTLNDSIANINIYSNINGSKIITTHSLINDYSNQIINYNSNSEININFHNQLFYPAINDKKIIDTLFENKKTGLLIGLYNGDNELVDKRYLSSLLFEVNGVEYYSNNKGLININLGSVSDYTIKTLKIKAKENSNALPEGSYHLKINSYISNDGYHYENLYNDEIIVPVSIDSQVDVVPNYNFFVDMNQEALIINKDEENSIISFNIVYSGDLTSPNVKVSLYEKKKLSAYDQEYSLVDLRNFVSNELNEVSSKQYSINIGTSTINLNTNNFNYNGYKYVFELYDGLKKIGEVQKYFIVR